MRPTLLLVVAAACTPTDEGPGDTDVVDTVVALIDFDQDGVSPPEDCDDADPRVSPRRPEKCGGGDDDCDGVIDEVETTTEGRTGPWLPDADGDAWGADVPPSWFCGPPPEGWVTLPGDCDDADPDIRPGRGCGGSAMNPPTSWETPQLLGGVNSGQGDAEPTMTADRKRICFASERDGGLGSADLWCMSRTSTSVDFASPVHQEALATEGLDTTPYLRPDGSELWFAATRSGDSHPQIYKATWNGQVYADPERVPELVSSSYDSLAPWLSHDGLDLWFDSWRYASGTRGGSEVWHAHRASLVDPFVDLELVLDLNTGYVEASPRLWPDGSVVVLTSTRAGGATGGRALWVATEKPGGGWNAPRSAAIDGAAAFSSMAGASFLADGTLLLHATVGSGKSQIYVARPRW